MNIKTVIRLGVFLAVLSAGVIYLPTQRAAGIKPGSLGFTDRFESLDAWTMPHPEDWAILGDNASGHYLHMKRGGDPGIPRRPLQFALLRNRNVRSFDLHVRVRRQGGSMILVYNYVDTLHYYYTHLSVDPGTKDGVHNGIFLVNNAPRVRIGGAGSKPALPDTSWHSIRLLRDVKSGRTEVWSDVQKEPLFTVMDRTFGCGQIGLGSFDETGDFADVDLKSSDAGCGPAVVAP